MNDKTKHILLVVLAILAGAFAAMMVNGTLIGALSGMIAPPEGVNPNDLESIKSNADKYELKHFLAPWLAHGLGSLAGGLVAALIAPLNKMRYALIVGGVHMIGGIMMVFMLKEFPIYSHAVDLIFAYIPMAWIGGTIGMLITGRK